MTDAAAGGRAASRRGTPAQRARAAGLRFASSIACRVPEGIANRVADLIGELWYRAAPARADRARRNFQRVAVSLSAARRGPARARAAATDRRALERLVRLAFRHDARYYLEVLRVPSLSPAVFRERVTIERPEIVEDAFSGGPVIFVSPHFGPIELPALYLAQRSGRTFVAPMETVDDPPLQAWFEATRGSLGVRIVGLHAARRALQSELRAGGYVGIVGDRDVTGGGIEVPFFGAPAPFPIGPALLAIESGARIFAVAVRRLPDGRVAGGLWPVPVATQGTRRERIRATLATLAAAFEEAIAEAPEQWSGAFFPIWPDLAADASSRPDSAGPDAASGGSHDSDAA
jgi:phosphatidylinositol dimannoside acyltransferase